MLHSITWNNNYDITLLTCTQCSPFYVKVYTKCLSVDYMVKKVIIKTQFKAKKHSNDKPMTKFNYNNKWIQWNHIIEIYLNLYTLTSLSIFLSILSFGTNNKDLFKTQSNRWSFLEFWLMILMNDSVLL